MGEPVQPLRIHVSWGPSRIENDRVRTILGTLGLAQVSTDEVATLFAKEGRQRREAAAGRRVSVRG